MLNEDIQKALNDQINLEFESAYIYLAMASYYEEMNLPGFSHWMREQSKEEVQHAMRIYDYVHDRSGHVTLRPLSGPKDQFASVRAVVEQALKHERHVTNQINKLYELAQKHHDYATQTHLHWFITEQVEEERVVSDVLARIELSGDAPAALIVLDRELAQRAGS